MHLDPILGPGLCQCGCGQQTPVSKITARTRGLVKGEHVRFIQGHYHRKPGKAYCVEDRGYETPCWIWQHKLDRKGYARASVNRRWVLAHRWVYEQKVGPIPVGLELDHLCRNRACVNPAHLEPVTRAENARRSRSAKLSHADVAEIRRQLGDGLTPRVIATAFGVQPQAIRRIRAGTRWPV